MLSFAVSAERKLAERLLSTIGPKSDSLAIIRRCQRRGDTINVIIRVGEVDGRTCRNRSELRNARRRARYANSPGGGACGAYPQAESLDRSAVHNAARRGKRNGAALVQRATHTTAADTKKAPLWSGAKVEVGRI